MTPYAMMGLDLAVRVTRYYGFPGCTSHGKTRKTRIGDRSGRKWEDAGMSALCQPDYFALDWLQPHK